MRTEEIVNPGVQEDLKKNRIISEDEELQEEDTTTFLDKKELVRNPQVYEIVGLGKNAFDRYYLIVDSYEGNVNINISKKNYNWLLSTFGPKIKLWRGQKVRISGEGWIGDVKGQKKEGVLLTLEKA